MGFAEVWSMFAEHDVQWMYTVQCTVHAFWGCSELQNFRRSMFYFWMNRSLGSSHKQSQNRKSANFSNLTNVLVCTTNTKLSIYKCTRLQLVDLTKSSIIFYTCISTHVAHCKYGIMSTIFQLSLIKTKVKLMAFC